MTTEDDWVFPPDSSATDRYQGQGNDLSSPIHQGQRVVDLRTLADLSPQVLANETGLTLSELLAIEAGLMALSRPVAVRMSAALGVHYTDLWINPDFHG